MLPIRTALIGGLARTGVIGTDIRPAVERSPVSSVLPDIESSGLFVYTGVSAPGSLPGTTASADSPPGCPVGVSPGKSALLPGTTAAFTSTAEPSGFAVLCQLAAP